MARIEEGLNAFNFLTYAYKPTGKRALGRSRSRWEDTITIYLKGIVVSTRNWIVWAHDRDYWGASVNATLNFRVPKA